MDDRVQLATVIPPVWVCVCSRTTSPNESRDKRTESVPCSRVEPLCRGTSAHSPVRTSPAIAPINTWVELRPRWNEFDLLLNGLKASGSNPAHQTVPPI